MLHRRRNKICSILVTSRPVGGAARRAFASTALARGDRRLLALSSEQTGIAVACGFASILCSSRRDRQPSACGGAPQSNHALRAACEAKRKLLHHDRFRAQDDMALIGSALNPDIQRLDILVRIRVHFGDEIFVRLFSIDGLLLHHSLPPPLRMQPHAWRGLSCASAGVRSAD
jgi:hypothetical protein